MLYNNWFMLSNFVSGSLCKCFSEIHPTLNERFFLHQTKGRVDWNKLLWRMADAQNVISGDRYLNFIDF